jgi:coatomer subunit beta
VKVKALKQTIMLLLSGESLPRVLMSVIRFCSNTEDHVLKKLLMLYWEVSPRETFHHALPGHQGSKFHHDRR